ncbi:hypothetical protein [Sphingobium sp. MI1205]|uniref:hypothetical protein n=1 Tax=Sphingobium sp. MI1205 TaxID=407020 RepID=UPI000AEF444A|nr:hypothetical protein [Sphingobium sp. MI1205]
MMRFLPRFEFTDHGVGGIAADDRFEWFEGRGLLIQWGRFLIEIVFARREQLG